MTHRSDDKLLALQTLLSSSDTNIDDLETEWLDSVTTPFVPTDIADCVLWFDANDIDTLWQDSPLSVPITADGQEVLGWADKGTSGTDVGSVATNGPLYKTGITNGLAGLLGDGIDDKMWNATPSLTQTLNFSVFCVAKLSGVTAGAVWNTTNTNLSRAAMFFDGTGTTLGLIDTAADPDAFIDLLSSWGTDAAQQTFIRDGANLEGWANGVSQDTETVTAASPCGNDYTRVMSQFNGVSPFAGYLHELIVYDATLGDTDRQAVESYLISKWGIT